MSEPLSIQGESVQRIYQFYIGKRFVVNRRYQRKLVWTIEEKSAFIDTLLKGFPVPLILLAEAEFNGRSCFEIIDGMQRLNAISSFLEGEFQLEGHGYFDLDALAETKQLKDNKDLQQKLPTMTREKCVSLAGYAIPISVYKETAVGDVDEIFRRINSSGRLLSPQELRQAGSIVAFSELVREIAARIRGDVSARDQLLLNQMKNISITNRNLPYGINVDDIFWCAQAILTKDQVRKSKDEELIADILAYILLDPKPASSSEILDGFYTAEGGGEAKDKSRADELDTALKKTERSRIVDKFITSYDALRRTLVEVDQKFNTLMFKDAGQRVPRYFQAVFLAYYELLNLDNLVLSSPRKAAAALNGIGEHIDVGKGGGRWSAKDRTKSIESVKGILRNAFKRRSGTDVSVDSWAVQLENILMQSTTENALYDLKQGFCRLDNARQFDDNVVAKVAETASAIANTGLDTVGYIIIGIADDPRDAQRVANLDGIQVSKYNGFSIVGLDREVAVTGSKSIDKYLQMVFQKLKAQPLEQELLVQILRDARNVLYQGKSVLVLEVKSLDRPSIFGDRYFERHHSNNIEVPAAEFGRMFRRFQRS